jgi:hypothetical protein
MLNICPSRYEEIGFFGIMLDTTLGISSNEKPSVTFKSSSERSWLSWSALRSKILPGAIMDASVTATSIAIVVVITK